MDVSLIKETDMDDPDNDQAVTPQRWEQALQASDGIARADTAAKIQGPRRRPNNKALPRFTTSRIDPSLVLQMKLALAAPAVPAKPDPARKPTAFDIVVQLRTNIEALRAGTAPACNGRRMSWREIADRIAKMTGLSEDSLRKAFAAATGQQSHVPRQLKHANERSTPVVPALTTAKLAESPVASARTVGSSAAAFGPLFDD